MTLDCAHVCAVLFGCGYIVILLDSRNLFTDIANGWSSAGEVILKDMD